MNQLEHIKQSLETNFKDWKYQTMLPKHNQGEAQPHIPKPNIKQTRY